MNLAKTLRVGLLSAVAAAIASTAFAGPVFKEFGPNLVTNGSFENTSVIAGSGWTPSGFIAEGFDYFIATNAADAESGTHSFAGGGSGHKVIQKHPSSCRAALQHPLARGWWFADNTGIDLWGGNLVFTQPTSSVSGTGRSSSIP
jgi:hypothetical protein